MSLLRLIFCKVNLGLGNAVHNNIKTMECGEWLLVIKMQVASVKCRYMFPLGFEVFNQVSTKHSLRTYNCPTHFKNASGKDSLLAST
jgi:hypothetical protein